MAEHTVATVDELEPGHAKCVEVNGIAIALFNVDGEFYATHNRCPHKGASMCSVGDVKIGDGELQQRTKGGVDPAVPSAFCPWHHWEWNLTTGENVAYPDERIPTFDVRVRGNEVNVIL